MPSGSFGAAGFLLYEATLSSGYYTSGYENRTNFTPIRYTFGDQSTSVIDRFLPVCSSEKAHTNLTLLPSESSLER